MIPPVATLGGIDDALKNEVGGGITQVIFGTLVISNCLIICVDVRVKER